MAEKRGIQRSFRGHLQALIQTERMNPVVFSLVRLNEHEQYNAFGLAQNLES